MSTRRLWVLALLIGAATDVLGCGAPAAGTDAGPSGDAGVSDTGALPDTGRADAGPTLDGGGGDATLDAAGGLDGGVDATTEDAGPVGCPAIASRDVVTVTGDITADTTWTCEHIYDLDQLVYVNGTTAVPVTLTIEPGTLIRGEPAVRDAGGGIVEFPGTLIVTRQGHLVAEGTAEAPIVFTSASAPGLRVPSDWGGVVLLGRGLNNIAEGERRMEGLPISGGAARTFFGALPGAAEADWNCGSLLYVRIEFAGFVLADSKELNSLTLASCGDTTRVSHVQLHMGSDDGIEFFGGSGDVDHVVITGAQDDSLDWDNGFAGRLQFIVAQHYPQSTIGGAATAADRGIEANNNTDLDPVDAAPLSSPRLFNLTFVGSHDGADGAGAVFRDGTHAFLADALMTGFGRGSVDIQDDSCAAATVTGEITIQNGIFEESALSSGTFWPNDTNDCIMNCAGPVAGRIYLTESSFFVPGTAPSIGNRETSGGTTVLPAPFDRAAPGWVPAASSPPSTGAVAPFEAAGEARPPFFDTTATYVGAFEPGDPVANDWTLGWTDYSLN